jgi:hypothetical protein
VPACCNPVNFKFKCPNGVCSPAPGRTCPDVGPLVHCPINNKPKPLDACYCAKVAANSGGFDVRCLADRGSCNGVTTCSANKDCKIPGEVCQLQSCCGGRNICVALCEARFPMQADDCT